MPLNRFMAINWRCWCCCWTSDIWELSVLSYECVQFYATVIVWILGVLPSSLLMYQQSLRSMSNFVRGTEEFANPETSLFHSETSADRNQSIAARLSTLPHPTTPPSQSISLQSWHSAMVVQTRRKAKAKGKSRPPHRGDQALDDKATRVNKQKIQKEQVTSTSLTTSISQDSRRDTIRSTMFELISHTQVSSTICPSQVPRTLHDRSPRTYPDWRAMMDEVRDEVWEQVRAGTVQVTQRGDVRDYEGRFDIKGPIRVKRGPNWDAR